MRERKDGGKEGGFEQVEGGSRDGGEFGEQGQTDRWKSAKVKSIYRSACFLLVPLFISPLCFQHSHMSLLTFTMHSRWSWIFHPHTHTHTRSYFPPDLTHCSTLHNSHPPLQAHIYNEQTHANYLLNFVKIRGHCRQNNRMRTTGWEHHVTARCVTTTTKCSDQANQWSPNVSVRWEQTVSCD